MESGARRYLDEDCDLIVAVGGGSSMDCAKCIGIVATSGSDIRELEGVGTVRVPGPPLICVPTTAGSSADVSPIAVITDVERRKKMVLISRLLIPDLSVIDPETTMTLDTRLTVSTGTDALMHALEAYVSNASSPMTDLFALEAARIIGQSLPAVHRPGTWGEDGCARLLYAGLAFSMPAWGSSSHEHALGGHDSITAGSRLLLNSVRFIPCARGTMSWRGPCSAPREVDPLVPS